MRTYHENKSASQKKIKEKKKRKMCCFHEEVPLQSDLSVPAPSDLAYGSMPILVKYYFI